MCRDVCTCIAEELTPLFLKQTGGLPIVLPDVTVDLLLPQHFRICLGPHVFLIFGSRGRNPKPRIINSGVKILRRLPLQVRFLMVHWVDKLERSHTLHIFLISP